MNRSNILAIIAATSLLLPTFTFAATNFKLTKGKLLSVSYSGKKYACGSPSSKWVPVKKVSGSTYTALKSASADHKSACASVVPRGVIKSLSQLPDIKDLTKAATQKSKLTLSGVSSAAVSGTAPVIPDVPNLDVTQLFWRTGVISSINSGSPSPEDCSEFWGSSEDGKSSGQTACYMLQDVGFTIGNIIQAGNSLCYMKKVPSAAVTQSGAVRITRGSVPGGIAKVFDVPSGSARSRIIKGIISGERRESEEEASMYIKVASQSELASGGNLYKYDMWDCVQGSIVSRESGAVRLNGEFIATSSNSGGDGTFENIVRGYVTNSGRTITFDTSRNRTISQLFLGEGDRLSASEIVVTPDNEIISKQRASSSQESQRSYSISSFSGSSIAELRFLSGATKMDFSRPDGEDTFTGSSEFRDTFYASAPNSSYAASVSEVEFSEDSFYSGELETPELNSRGISCSPQTDVEITISMDSDAMSQVREQCEGIRLDGFNMCQNEALTQAYENYSRACILR